jgi:hypothetical protein
VARFHVLALSALDAIVIRHERDDAAWRALGARCANAVGPFNRRGDGIRSRRGG